MRAGTFARSSPQHTKPLVIRGGLARTFGSLVSFVAALFFCLGLYLLGDAFIHPLNAGAAGILAAALSITLAVVLLFYLLKPQRARFSLWGRFRRER